MSLSLIHDNINYLPVLPYVTDNITEMLIYLLYLAVMHTA